MATVEGGRQGALEHYESFCSRHLGNERTVVVYLPPGYRETHQRYPVVYFHDGQNVFDASTAAYGTAWDAEKAAEQLVSQGRLPPLIMVGIYNTSDRHFEYTYHVDRKLQEGGRGHLYGRFLFEEVKPFVDLCYRTLPDRHHTAVIGSSLGGLLTLCLAQSHWESFELCGALSPSLWWSRSRILRDFKKDNQWLQAMRFWVDMGTRESDSPRSSHAGILRARKLITIFDEARLIPGRDYYYHEVDRGEHNEANWAGRIGMVLLYLFGDRI